MKKIAKPALFVTVFLVIASVCAMIVVTTLRAPVGAPTSEYTATFSDVAGLHVGDDVRIAGVQVGKVQEVELAGRNADVGFSALADRRLYANTVVAVRYQNLTGQRYLEIVQPDAPGAVLRPGSALRLLQTIPSFDISKLFNGFQPIFRTLDPAQFNQFGENLLRVVQGDGSGLGPVLRDLESLSKFAVNRQAVFLTLIRNLGAVSADLGGRSKELFGLIAALNDVVAQYVTKGEALRQAVDRALPVLRNTTEVLEYGEGVFDSFTGPAYDLITRIFPHTSVVIEGLSLMPSLIQGLRDQIVNGHSATPQFECSNGMAILPGVGQVSFAEQNLVVCK